MWNGLDYKRVYRSNRLGIYKRLARMILEQAMEDFMQTGNPIKDRPKYHKDAKRFFENQDYDLFCECAEIDVGEMDRWVDGLDLK